MGDEFALLLQKDANGALVTGKLAIFCSTGTPAVWRAWLMVDPAEMT